MNKDAWYEREIERLEKRFAHVPNITEEELKKIIPIEFSAKERLAHIEERRKILIELCEEYGEQI